jgi:hypothetical protein
MSVSRDARLGNGGIVFYRRTCRMVDVQALRKILILTRHKKSYDLLKRQKSNVIQVSR